MAHDGPVASTGHGTYRPDVDGLRAVAITSVLIFHIDPPLLPGGFAGVDIFFIISGYLISGIIFRELDQKRFTLTGFYMRRIRRIFPALIVVLLATWLIGCLVLLPNEFRALGQEIAAGAAFVFNLDVYRAQGWYFGLDAPSPLLHLWSLGVEEQFYFLWPLLMLATWRLTKLRFGLLAILTLASFTANVLAVSSDPLADFYLPWNRLWELSLGGMLAYVELRNLNERQQRNQRPWQIALSNLSAILGVCLLVVAFITLDGSGKAAYPGWAGILPCAATLLLISAGNSSWINRSVFAAKPVVFVGLVSYPLYLWHLPLLATARIMGWSTLPQLLAAVAIAFLLATITYLYVERPVRSAPRSPRLVTAFAGLMAVCIAIGVMTWRGVLPARSAAYPIEQFVRAGTEDWLPNSDKPAKAGWTLASDEPLLIEGGPKRALFVGDSFMQQYYQRIEKLVHDHPLDARTAVFMVRGGCVPGGVELLNRILPEAYVTKCRQFLASALDYARDPSVDTIVIAGSWETYFLSGCFHKEATGSAWRRDSERGLDELQRSLMAFAGGGKRVYLVLSHPAPGPKVYAHRLIRRSLLAPAFELRAAQESVPRSQICDAEGLMAVKLNQIAARTGARIIDPKEFLCDELTCRVMASDGLPIYRDSHLRPSYVRENGCFLDATVIDSGSGCPPRSIQSIHSSAEGAQTESSAGLPR